MTRLSRILGLWLFALSSAIAGPISVGSIIVDDYRVTGGAADTFGGANLIIHYELKNFDKQDCCKEENLRWLQLAQFIPDQAGFPKGPFIDPQPGQDFGLGKGDDLPFYDLTGGNIDDLTGKGTIGRGKGAFLGDGPFDSWALGDVEFILNTLLVCILDPTADMKMIILGGVSSGYSNDSKNKKTTLKPMHNLADGAGLRKSFNDALDAQAKFKAWDIVEASTACNDNAPCVSLVPEPGSAWLLLFGVVVVGRLRRCSLQ